MRRAYFWGKVQDGVFPRGEKGWGRLGPGWAVGTSTRRCPEFAHVHLMASDTPSQETGGAGARSTRPYEAWAVACEPWSV